MPSITDIAAVDSGRSPQGMTRVDSLKRSLSIGIAGKTLLLFAASNFMQRCHIDLIVTYFGRAIRKVEPEPTLLLAVIWPFCRSIMVLAMDRPKP